MTYSPISRRVPTTLRWRSGVLSGQRTSTADGVGATYRQELRGPDGRTIEGDYRVTASAQPLPGAQMDVSPTLSCALSCAVSGRSPR
jgi:hypothetical protein